MTSTHDFDFHRNVFVLIPETGSKHETFLVAPTGKGQNARVFCTCSRKGYGKCESSQKLHSLYQSYCGDLNWVPWEAFLKSRFWAVLEPILKFQTNGIESIQIQVKEGEIVICDGQNRKMVSYFSDGHDRERLISRISGSDVLSRYRLMNKAISFVQTEHERTLLASGYKTQRQTIEDSFWYRFAYHCFREAVESSGVPVWSIEPETGQFLVCFELDTTVKAKIFIPLRAVPGVLGVLEKNGTPGSLLINSDEAELVFRIRSETDSYTLIPAVKYSGQGAAGISDLDKRFIYETMVYIGNAFYRLTYQSIGLIATGWGVPRRIEKERLSEFLQTHGEVFSSGKTSGSEGESLALDLFAITGETDYGRIVEPPVIRSLEKIELQPRAIEKESCVLSVSYSFEGHTVSLSQIITARKKKIRFIYANQCLFDLESTGIRAVLVAAKGVRDGTITLSRAALLQFRGSTLSTRIFGDEKLVNQVKQLVQFRPLQDLTPLAHLHCTLRDYQNKGVQWLLFLYDNRFGGLLCDEMGLGKTVQVIAFLLALKEQRNVQGTSLIVCPTSVLSHWTRLAHLFAPSLNVHMYHAQERRDLLKEKCDLLLTTYGILRNDIAHLNTISYNIVIFDEAQQLKNTVTVGHGAALSLQADMKLGLTGTPIENRLSDLKALFDLVLPGLLDESLIDDEQFLNGVIGTAVTFEIKRLQRLINPFILRRLKKSVLSELPPKIEDIRSCSMSDEQKFLYTEALTQRGGPLIEALKNREQPIPYMHVFSLLSFLKQVCNHPACAAGRPEEYEYHQSGKWDLFTELLDECLGSGEKVVIFSQYLHMIEIVRLYLQARSIGHVILTGASRNRDKIIKQFSDDKDCQVFAGSLKAGGVGIDLVAASVVIHYDRWWNAAREDQATDRVHRIGQNRGVQVLKLITENTIEERIGGIIERKKTLSEATLSEDSPEMVKRFSREELLELLGV